MPLAWLKRWMVILGCAFGGAVSMSFLSFVGAFLYFDGDYVGLAAFLSIASPAADICGAAIAAAVFVCTSGRGHIRGLGRSCPTEHCSGQPSDIAGLKS